MGGNVNFNPATTQANGMPKAKLNWANLAKVGIAGGIAAALKALGSSTQVEEQNGPREFKMFSDKEPDYEHSNNEAHYAGEVGYCGSADYSGVSVSHADYENSEVVGQYEVEIPYERGKQKNNSKK